MASRDGRRDATAWSGLALVRARLGDTDGSREANLKVLELAPGDLDTLRNLAILERDAGNAAEACGYVEEGLASNSQDTGLIQLYDALGCGNAAGAAPAAAPAVTETAPAAP